MGTRAPTTTTTTPTTTTATITTPITTITTITAIPSKNPVMRGSSSNDSDIETDFDLMNPPMLTPLQKEAQRVLLELLTHVPEQLQFLTTLEDSELSFVDEALSSKTISLANNIAKFQLMLENNREIINAIRTMRSAER